MYLLRCLILSLLVCPTVVLAATEAQTADASQAAPAIPSAEVASIPQRDLLEKRVMAKWDALIKKDFATAYSFTSPAYRQLYSENQFRAKFGNKVNWQRIEVVDVDFKGEDAATVGINIHFVYYDGVSQKPLDMRNYVQEPWVRVDGQWWYLMKM